METRSRRKAGPLPVPPEGVLTDPASRSPVDPEEDLGLTVLMGDREVPLVGRDQAAARGPTSGPEDTPAVSEWVPAREPVSDYTRAPSTLSSPGQVEPAATTAVLEHAQQRPFAPTLDTRSQQSPTLVGTAAAHASERIPTLGAHRNPTLKPRNPTLLTRRKHRLKFGVLRIQTEKRQGLILPLSLFPALLSKLDNSCKPDRLGWGYVLPCAAVAMPGANILAGKMQ